MFFLPDINAYRPRVVLPRQPSAGNRKYLRVAKAEHDLRRCVKREEGKARVALATAFVSDIPGRAVELHVNDIVRQEGIRRAMVENAWRVAVDNLVASAAIDRGLQAGRDADVTTQPRPRWCMQQRQILASSENVKRLGIVFDALAALALANAQGKEALGRVGVKQDEAEVRGEILMRFKVYRPVTPPKPPTRPPYPHPPSSGKPWARPTSANRHYTARDSIMAVLNAHRCTNAWFQNGHAARLLQRVGQGMRNRQRLLDKYRRVTDPHAVRYDLQMHWRAVERVGEVVRLPSLLHTA